MISDQNLGNDETFGPLNVPEKMYKDTQKINKIMKIPNKKYTYTQKNMYIHITRIFKIIL